jgi:hypothetical protein
MNDDQTEAWNTLQGKVKAYTKDEHGNLIEIWVDPKDIQIDIHSQWVDGVAVKNVRIYDKGSNCILDSIPNI